MSKARQDEILSAADVADMIGVTRQRLWSLLKSGQLRGYKTDKGAWKITRSDAEDFLKMDRPSGVSIAQRKC